MTKFYYINLKYITLYHTYRLLYFKGHIKITCIHSTINIEKNKIVRKIITFYYINLEIMVHYITLTD